MWRVFGEIFAMLVLGFFIGFFLFMLFWKIAFNYGGGAKLNLRTFKNIYRINKLKWEFSYGDFDDVRHLRYRCRQVKLSFFAFLWFLFDRAVSCHRRCRKSKRDALIFILEDCQEDINALKKEADNEIKMAVKEQKRILNNWKYYV